MNTSLKQHDQGSLGNPLWKGAHGEWYVVIQMVILLFVVFGPRTLPGLPAWCRRCAIAGSIAGWILILGGGFLALAGGLRLGKNLTAVPYPKADATLVESGPYALVRHPIYSGLILAALGCGLAVHGWLTLGYAVALLVFFDVKSRLEEKWLLEKFERYATYQKRVRKLIPWIY